MKNLTYKVENSTTVEQWLLMIFLLVDGLVDIF